MMKGGRGVCTHAFAIFFPKSRDTLETFSSDGLPVLIDGLPLLTLSSLPHAPS
jgi:hypothetical protein